MSGELRLGLAGCGRLAEVGYVPAVRRAGGVTLVGVADPVRARRERAAPEAAGHATLAELIERQELDAVVLATPAPAHLDDARRVAARGLPCLVEKPPAPDAPAARALARLDPLPFVGFNRRFDPGVAALRERLGSEPGGDLELRLELRYRRGAWGAYQAADTALLDLGPHLVDLARWISRQEVVAVRAASVEPRQAELDLELEEARARVRCASDRSHREVVEARIGPGRRERHRSGGPVTGALAMAGRALRRAGDHPLVTSLTAQLEAFERAVHGHPAAPLATALDGVAAMAVVDAARVSARSGGRWVESGTTERNTDERGAPATRGAGREATAGGGRA
ncbi:MAG TPA: Gfo/Idh/MocA family oxidoreductase [Thermoleophilaceae bacterium]|nr:Gfo/Idh/MocA family oxidoreductase [Thermoleophilaceae bacterium]